MGFGLLDRVARSPPLDFLRPIGSEWGHRRWCRTHPVGHASMKVGPPLAGALSGLVITAKQASTSLPSTRTAAASVTGRTVRQRLRGRAGGTTGTEIAATALFCTKNTHGALNTGGQVQRPGASPSEVAHVAA